jgi:hypothetical protein
MLGKYAWQFFLLSRFLNDLHRRLDLPPPQPPAMAGITTAPHGALARALMSDYIGPGIAPAALQGTPPVLSAEDRENFADLLGFIDRICKTVDIVSVSGEVGRAVSVAKISGDRAELRFHIENLGHRITEELGSQEFLHVPSQRARYYRDNTLFGEAVSKKLPKAADDITHAASCFALGQNTACVFHLMRVMEYVVQRFGMRLKVPLKKPRDSSWTEIMDLVNQAVKALPGGKKHNRAQNLRKQRFSAAAGRLDHVRLVWRNEVMHPKATYDEAEALEVLTAVEAFLKSVVLLL